MRAQNSSFVSAAADAGAADADGAADSADASEDDAGALEEDTARPEGEASSLLPPHASMDTTKRDPKPVRTIARR